MIQIFGTENTKAWYDSYHDVVATVPRRGTDCYPYHCCHHRVTMVWSHGDGSWSEDFPCYPCTRLGIGEGMVVVFHDVATGLRHGMQLVVGKQGEVSACGTECVVEGVVGVIHLIDAKRRLEASLVKHLVVCDEGKPLDERLNLCPDVREDGSVVGVFVAQAVDLRAPIVVEIRLGLDERIERVFHFAIANDDNPHGTDGAAMEIGGFEVYGGKVFHV